ncbi:MAG: acetyltransferase [Dechloromonas sp.]|nr:MAG: acetyltransferase [Dechloromonas sp.]
MTLPLIIVGAGGHGRVLLDFVREQGREVLGFVDSNPALWAKDCGGIPILGGDDVLERITPSAVELVNGIGSVGVPLLRARVHARLKELGFVFATLCHPRATVAVSARLAAGVQVMAGAVVQSGARLNEDVIVNTGAIIEHDCVIGAHSHIAPRAVLCGEVEVGALAHVGVGACVVQRLRVGDKALVAAGAVVVANVPAGANVAGVPARHMVKK